MSSQILLKPSWKKHLISEFDQAYMIQLKSFLLEEKKKKKIIYPKGNEYFQSMNLTDFAKVKVVILGQDPYHGPRQAHGLSFSVPLGISIPRSLLNIYKELEKDLKIPRATHGCLEKWSQEGVLLLNSTLTVEAGRAGSHRGKGWEEFTNQIISLLNEKKENLVFLLWGKSAQEKGQIINRAKHQVLQAPHPSPFSADRGFFGCRHFSKTNKYLKSKNLSPIDWSSHLNMDKRSQVS